MGAEQNNHLHSKRKQRKSQGVETMEKRDLIIALIDEVRSLYMDIDVLENENTNLQHKIDELEAQLLEIAQSKITVDYGPMTDPAGKGVL